MIFKILVVDDEEQIRKLLIDFLTRVDFEVIAACGGEEAIECLKARPDIDLMIVDIRMPRVTGLDVLKKKNSLNDTRPIIILTGSIDTEKYLPELKELGLGFNDVITKPIDLYSLLGEMKRKLRIA
jgi:CheY-like chemotaxis protein